VRCTLSVCVIPCSGDHELTDAIDARIEQVCGLSRAHSSYTQLLRYQSADENPTNNVNIPNHQTNNNHNDDGYALHTDCTSDIGSNTRAWTFLAYLSSAELDDGGHTAFPLMNISIRPSKGMALVFRSLDDDGFCTAKSRHMSTPLTPFNQQSSSLLSSIPSSHHRVKSVLQKWFMSKRFDEQPHWGDDPIVKYLLPNQRSYVTCSVVGSCREYAPLYPMNQSYDKHDTNVIKEQDDDYDDDSNQHPDTHSHNDEL
jgi:hypothetical protein